MNRITLTPRDKRKNPVVFECCVAHNVGSSAIQVVSYKDECYIYNICDFEEIQILPVTDERLEESSDELKEWHAEQKRKFEERQAAEEADNVTTIH